MAPNTSSTTVVVLHNPRCSKSRATVALLGERGIPFEERRYLDEPLSRRELDDLRAKLDRPVREWIRTGEAAFAEAGLSLADDDATLLDAIADHPVLMERPIVVRGERAAIGRPPQQVLDLFDE